MTKIDAQIVLKGEKKPRTGWLSSHFLPDIFKEEQIPVLLRLLKIIERE